MPEGAPGQSTTSFQEQKLTNTGNAVNDVKESPFTGKVNTPSVQVPQINLPKGGGAIKSIDEKFSVNAANGTATFSLPLPLSEARGFSAAVELSYNSGAGNGVFGLGWSLSVPSIKRKTEKELPQYIDAIDSDTYILSGREDLVPEYKTDNSGNFLKDGDGHYILNDFDVTFSGIVYRVRRYRSRIEGLFSRIERWTEKSTGFIHWRVISKDNVTSLYGKNPAARNADPVNTKRVFEWFPEFTYDDKGNAVLYEYKPEDGAGINPSFVHNKNRTNGIAPFTNTYLKRILAGNKTPYTNQGEVFPAAGQFLFETVFDYGERDALNLPFPEVKAWDFRADAFSEYRSGFEIRTCRLCKRVLLYHHFNELPGGSALVKSLDLTYDNNGENRFTFLKKATLTGYTKHDDSSYTQKSFPPFSFDYQKMEWNTDVKTMAQADVVNTPFGIDGLNYQLVDLYSEGLPGILTEQSAAWFYKSNLGGGHFTAPTLVLSKPSFNGLKTGLQLVELEANGIKQLVNWQTEPKGFFELSDEEEWRSFVPFELQPAINISGKQTRLLDLNGDGIADVLITEQDVFTWYPSKGKKGYAESIRTVKAFNEEKGPAIIFDDGTESIFLADMSGDGISDIVRIRNGEVCYWPNLGYGKFGAKVTMDGAPFFNDADEFNPLLVKLADLDGSGTTDIIYPGRNQLRIWLNQQGNAFLPPKIIDFFPATDNLTKITVADLLGTGLGCILWSNALPENQNAPLRYIDLMNSKKPHILRGYKNNLGKEIELEYTPSTQFYIADKLAGTPWVTKLPFPVQCVNKVITYDRIRKTRLASEYSYHHGNYDHFEREFRGFGRVDQKDTEDITHFILQGGTNTIIEKDLQQPPVLIKSWFHTGAFLDRKKVLNQFAHEYFQNAMAPENSLPEPELPDDITPDEFREALRSCKGVLLRKEVYAPDGTADEKKPYVAEQHNYLIKVLQPVGSNKHGVFYTHESEMISYHYERNPADPRTEHTFVLDIDKYGNVLQSARVVYPRKTNPLPEAEQVQLHITFTENTFTNDVQLPLDYRLPLTRSSLNYEVTGVSPAGSYFLWSEIKTACTTASVIDYEVLPNGSLQKRVVEFIRTRYRGDDTTTVLSFGVLQSKGLVHQTFKAAFNNALLNTIFSSKISLASLNTVLTNPAGGAYVFADNYYWIPSLTANYDAAHFYLSTRYTDPFGNLTQVNYDSNYFLFIQQVIDALNNTVQADQFNYRVLQPYVMKDANDNLSAVRFDELGMVVKTFMIGKKGVDKGDELDDSKTELKSAVDFPGSELEYNLDKWLVQSTAPGFDLANYKPEPAFVKTRTRETHYNAHPLHQTKWQESYTYSDGNAQVVLTKNQAEPGKALQIQNDGTVVEVDTTPNVRWAGNGRTILNNKGNAVKQYEPYFSTLPSFDDEKDMVELGVTPVIHYDPLNRIIQTDFPNKTFSRVEFTPWLQKTSDANDTVMDSQWYADRGSPNPLGAEPTNPDQRAAWLAAKHNNTPTIAHLDTLGRNFLTIADTATETISTRTIYDIEGNVLQMKDGLNRTVMTYSYDLSNNKIKQTSLDAGNRWTINDAAGNPLLNWDDRNHQFSFEYDALHRPVSLSVEESGITTLFDKTEYGESLPVAVAKASNLRNRLYKHYDQSGITTNLQYDFKGNSLSGTKQFAKDYKNKIDWATVGSVVLVTEIFESTTEYDALNRPIKIRAPHLSASPVSELVPGYNEAALLETMDGFIRGSATATHFITNINYNAKGQREAIFYGNGTRTAQTFEKETFRLLRILTTRNSGADILQDINYTYDPVGNPTQVKDNAQPDVFFDGEQAKALNLYEYDALYRLLKATGRKHAGQTDISHSGVGSPSNFRNHPFINSGTINPNDAQAFRTYTENYQYDKAGNMLQQQHLAKSSNWTRTFDYTNGTNQLTGTSVGAFTTSYTYDAHGNLQLMEHLLQMIWDFHDQFKEASLGGGGRAYYVYDATGQRVRKVIERLDGTKQER
jgi:hypothetical protein